MVNFRKKVFALVSSAFISVSAANHFTDTECDYVFGVTSISRNVSSYEVVDIGVFANTDFEARSTIEIQPSALVSTYGSYYSILHSYVHGYNKTHTTLFFGSSSLMNHGNKNKLDNVFSGIVPQKWAKSGSYDVAVVTEHAISSGAEMFTFYLATEKQHRPSQDFAGRFEEFDTYVPWFENRGIKYVNTDDPKVYPATLDSVREVLPGCSDNAHLNVSQSGVFSRLEIKKGDILETNRILFVFKDYFKEDPKFQSLLWEIEGFTSGISLGAIIPFAETTNDESKANIELKWWKSQIHISEKLGIMSVIAKQDIPANTNFIIYSSSKEDKVFSSNLIEEYLARKTWVYSFMETYERTELATKLYAAVLGFVLLISIVL